MKENIRLSLAGPYRLLFLEEIVNGSEIIKKVGHYNHSYSVTCNSQRAKTFAIKVDNFLHLMKLATAKEAMNMKVISLKRELRAIDQNDNRKALSNQVCDVKQLPNGRVVMGSLAKPIDEEWDKEVCM